MNQHTAFRSESGIKWMWWNFSPHIHLHDWCNLIRPIAHRILFLVHIHLFWQVSITLSEKRTVNGRLITMNWNEDKKSAQNLMLWGLIIWLKTVSGNGLAQDMMFFSCLVSCFLFYKPCPSKLFHVNWWLCFTMYNCQFITWSYLVSHSFK